MLKLMLESVSGLLDEASDAKTMKATNTFICSAQIILMKCIESLEQPSPTPLSKDLSTRTQKKKAESHEYEIRVDNKKLVQIVDKDGNEAPGDLPIEIDGKATTYEASKGQPFTQGKFL